VRERSDSDPGEHFLEDGIAPPVIGGGPPESPFEAEYEEPEQPGRHHAPQGQPPPGQRAARLYDQDRSRQEPPTSPIPVIRPLPPQQEQQPRRSWISRVLRLPGK
jgi:hypothetical protein